MTYIDKLSHTRSYLTKAVGVEGVFVNEPMKNHTSFKTGGTADLFVCPKDIRQLNEIINHLTEMGMPFFIMGNGTNLLVRDGGYRGAIVKIRENMSEITVSGNVIKAQAGALLSAVSKTAYENSLSGLEFAEGIPGTVGGAVAMNAGAYGGEIKDVTSFVTAIDTNGRLYNLSNSDASFCYRGSILQKNGLICTSAEFSLNPKDKNSIKNKMDENKHMRTEKQPLSLASAGSTFKRPDGYFAGKLIMDSGLKGVRVGGASVSTKHCGFVVNDSDASASDIESLITLIQESVYEKYSVKLEPEVKIIGSM